MEKINTTNTNTVEDLKQQAFIALQQTGFNQISIEKIQKSKNYTILVKRSPEMVYSRIPQNLKIFQELGYTQAQIIHIAQHTPSVLLYNKDNIQNVFQYFSQLGITQDDTIKITTAIPHFLNKKNTEIDTYIDNFISKGFTKQDVINILKRHPIGITNTSQSLQSKIDFLNTLGMTKENITNILVDEPVLLNLSNNFLSKKINFLVKQGVDVNSLLQAPSKASKIIILSTDKITEKILFLNKIGIDLSKKDNFDFLTQNITILHSKYNILKNVNKHKKKLTPEEINLIKGREIYTKYGITASEALANSPYTNNPNETKNSINIKEDIER